MVATITDTSSCPYWLLAIYCSNSAWTAYLSHNTLHLHKTTIFIEGNLYLPKIAQRGRDNLSCKMRSVWFNESLNKIIWASNLPCSCSSVSSDLLSKLCYHPCRSLLHFFQSVNILLKHEWGRIVIFYPRLLLMHIYKI